MFTIEIPLPFIFIESNNALHLDRQLSYSHSLISPFSMLKTRITGPHYLRIVMQWISNSPRSISLDCCFPFYPNQSFLSVINGIKSPTLRTFDWSSFLLLPDPAECHRKTLRQTAFYNESSTHPEHVTEIQAA